jgi:hypothetical protein
MKILYLAISIFCVTNIVAQNKNTFTDKSVTTRPMDKFTKINVHGIFTVHFVSGNSYDIAVGTDDASIQQQIITKVKDGVLDISSTQKLWSWFGENSKVNIYISTPMLTHIQASGAAKINLHDFLNTKELALVFSGASEFNGKVNVESLYAVFSGASDMKISGRSSKATFKFSGASDASAYSLSADTVQLIASGASSMHVTALKNLDAVVSGASDIKYKGSPALNVRSSGASSVHKTD